MGIERFTPEHRALIAAATRLEVTDELLTRFYRSAQDQADARHADRLAAHKVLMDEHAVQAVDHQKRVEACADRNRAREMRQVEMTTTYSGVIAENDRRRKLLNELPLEWRGSIPEIVDPDPPEAPKFEYVEALPVPEPPKPETEDEAIAKLVENLADGLTRARNRAADDVPGLQEQVKALEARIAALESGGKR